jgi:hypothetical protein
MTRNRKELVCLVTAAGDCTAVAAAAGIRFQARVAAGKDATGSGTNSRYSCCFGSGSGR